MPKDSTPKKSAAKKSVALVISPKARRGRASDFDADQKLLIQATYAEWEKLLLQHDPQFNKRRVRELDDWKAKKIDELLAMPAFQSLDFTTTDWASKAKTCYQTQRNKLARRHVKTQLTVQQEDSEHDVIMCRKKLNRAATELAALKCFEIDGRELFRHTNHQLIIKRAKGIAAANAGAQYQKAWAEMWKEISDEEKTSYEEEALGQPNKWENQEEFHQYLLQCANALCQSGQLGEMEMVIFTGFRNQTGAVDAKILHAHSSPSVNTSFDTSKVKGLWANWCEKFIPMIPDAHPKDPAPKKPVNGGVAKSPSAPPSANANASVTEKGQSDPKRSSVNGRALSAELKKIEAGPPSPPSPQSSIRSPSPFRPVENPAGLNTPARKQDSAPPMSPLTPIPTTKTKKTCKKAASATIVEPRKSTRIRGADLAAQKKQTEADKAARPGVVCTGAKGYFILDPSAVSVKEPVTSKKRRV